MNQKFFLALSELGAGKERGDVFADADCTKRSHAALSLD
jgi:hypothetical protein